MKNEDDRDNLVEWIVFVGMLTESWDVLPSVCVKFRLLSNLSSSLHSALGSRPAGGSQFRNLAEL